MAQAVFTLDSDIFIDLLRQRHDIMERFRTELENNARFVVCPVVYHEVLRGLLKRNATAQLQRFAQLVDTQTYADLTRADWEEAAAIWATPENDGNQIGERDILIAVFARRLGCTLITGNHRHFQRVSAAFENWRQLPANCAARLPIRARTPPRRTAAMPNRTALFASRRSRW